MRAGTRDGCSLPGTERVMSQGASNRPLQFFSMQAAQELFESAPDPIVITDAAGAIVLVNLQGEQRFGYSRDELLGLPVEVLLPERFRAQHVGHRAAYERAPRTRPMGVGLELYARRKDGAEFPVEISLSPLRLEQGLFVISIVRDISERKRLEQEREELLATVSYILDGVSDAIVAVNPAGHVVRVNAAACQLLRKAPEEVLGQPLPQVFRWEDEAGRVLEEHEYAFRQTFATGAQVVANYRFFRKPDGTRVPVAVSSRLVRPGAPGSELIVQVVRDVSREREVEALKDQIISLVSHELRTPIAHIKGFSSSLLEPDVEWDAATQRDFIEEIDREADRLAALVRDLLDMSRIESGVPFLEKGWTTPAAVTTQALDAVAAVTAGHRVVNQVGVDLPAILVDAGQIERVLANLVENAAKYSPAGTEIQVEARVGPGVVQWAVTDQGPGIPPEQRQRVFEKFVRLRGEGARKPGTGLGLPICKGIVEAHGGKLWLEAPARGARFCFTVPLEA